MDRAVILAFLCCCCFAISSASKMYSGQRIFNDLRMIDFVDPAKHGFHIILDQTFVDVYLQPTKLPTVFAAAIPLKRAPEQWRHERPSTTANRSTAAVVIDRSKSGGSTSSSSSSMITTHHRRVTKVLYPENGGPEDGLLDGRTIKLLGLQERSWYYVCVEFESNMNRHEVATGLNCQLKRTLDKFGKTVESTVNDLELLEITDRSITVRLTVETDFPLSLTVYLDPSVTAETGAKSIVSVPAHTFVMDRSRTLTIAFGPHLSPDTPYGRLCVLEEPVVGASEVYSAMGRAIRATIEHCYFDNELKTKPLDVSRRAEPRGAYKEHLHMAEEPSTDGKGRSKNGGGHRINAVGEALILVVALISLLLLG